MSAIQTGSNWWVDSVARFSGGTIGSAFRSGAMNSTAAAPLNSDAFETSDSISSAVSDTEEEGEISPAHADHEAESSPVDLIAEEIDSNSTDMGVAEEIVAAAAMQIGVIEAAMRQHQATGVVNFDDDEAHSGAEDPTDSSFEGSFLVDLMQNPNAALATTTPSLDRMGLFALLAN